MKAPFPIDPVLTGIAIAYRNRALIADGVLPRVPVGKKEFKFWKFPLGTFFTVPDTRVGRKGRPNEVEMGAVETPDACEDFGLDDPIPQDDIDNAPASYNPVNAATEFTTDLIELDREQRTAAKVFDLNAYAATHRVTLAGADQWSDFASATSDPIDDINTGLDAVVMRPNLMVIGRAAWSRLSRHPRVVKAFHGNDGGEGQASKQFVAQLFELEEVLVGEAFVNTAKPGQPAVLARAWGKHCALIHRNRLANTQRGTTFGYTAQFGTRVAGQIPDTNIGLRGGVRVRTGESVKEVICANDLGYFIQNAVA